MVLAVYAVAAGRYKGLVEGYNRKEGIVLQYAKKGNLGNYLRKKSNCAGGRDRKG